MKNRAYILFIGIFINFSATVFGANYNQSFLDVELVSVSDQYQEMFKRRGRQWLNTQPWYDAGINAGVDFDRPTEPMIAHSFKNNRLFYIFYNDLVNANGEYSFAIQRVKKTLKYYQSAHDTHPATRVLYLVEAFKLEDGRLKRADQHFGEFPLGKYYKREIIKEFTIGFGEIQGLFAGTAWPYSQNILYKLVQPYQNNAETYNKVRFSKYKKWKVTVNEDRSGRYSIQSKDLGLNVRNK